MSDNLKMIIPLLIVSAPIVILIIAIIYDNLSGNAKRRAMQHWSIAPDGASIWEHVSYSCGGGGFRDVEFNTEEEYREAYEFCKEKARKEWELKREREQWKEKARDGND
jgi:hypothetical protein